MTKPRNRDDTRARILDAGLSLLSEQGFAGFGVNAVARAAGCDKQLIYRYFDGLPGLTRAMGETVAARLATALSPALDEAPDSYGALIERLALALYTHLAGNAAWRQFRVLELTAPSAATADFRAARSAALQDWIIRARGPLQPPAGHDAAARNATLIAAVEGLAILGPAGLDPQDPATPDRLRQAIGHLARAAYAP
ncbi:MAG: TetR/AcrR family transcriptional regulator [Gemmobacter sp.]